jgi:regulator of sigma E protease
METAIQILEFALGLIILIIMHEFGHFLAARSLKIEVEEFGIGFPPRAKKLFRLWDTDFTLNWIPLGGFVRPKGENDPTIEGGLAAANPWKRLIVLVAGPAMNIFIALVLGAILFYQMGKPVSDKVLIMNVAPNSPAEQVGLMPGDLILSINGTAITGQQSLQEQVSASLGKATILVYEREGQSHTVTLVPRLNPPEGQGAIGIQMSSPTVPIGIGEAIQQGASATGEQINQLLHLPLRLASGEVPPGQGRLVGYRGMFMIYERYREFQGTLEFFMMISISLGVINLLPIPALDGGRILLTLPEIFLRRRVPAKFENALHMAGFTLLIILLLYVNIQDFVNPIKLP